MTLETEQLNATPRETPDFAPDGSQWIASRAGLWRNWPQDAKILAQHLRISERELLQLLTDEKHYRPES